MAGKMPGRRAARGRFAGGNRQRGPIVDPNLDRGEIDPAISADTDERHAGIRFDESLDRQRDWASLLHAPDAIPSGKWASSRIVLT